MYINKEDYDEKILKDNEILLTKKKKIIVKGFFEFNNIRNTYSFNNSTILSCSINKLKMELKSLKILF